MSVSLTKNSSNPGRFIYQHTSVESVRSEDDEMASFMAVLAFGVESQNQPFESQVEQQMQAAMLEMAQQHQQTYLERQAYIDEHLADKPEAALGYFLYGEEFEVLKNNAGSESISEIYADMQAILKAEEAKMKAIYEIASSPDAAESAMSDEDLMAKQDAVLEKIFVQSMAVKEEIENTTESKKFKVESSFRTKVKAENPSDQETRTAMQEGVPRFEHPTAFARAEVKNVLIKDMNRNIVLTPGLEAWGRAKDETEGKWKDRFGVYTKLTYEEFLGAQKDATFSLSARPKIMITSDGYRLELRGDAGYELKDKVDLSAFGAYIMTPNGNMIRAGVASEIPTKTGDVKIELNVRQKLQPGEPPSIWGGIKKEF